MRALLRSSASALRARYARRPVVALALAALSLAAAPAGAMAHRWLFTDTVWSNSTKVHTIYESGSRVVVDGDNDTDLDCYLYKNGRLVDYDDDATDYCILDTYRTSAPYTLYIKNLGNVYNRYDVHVD